MIERIERHTVTNDDLPDEFADVTDTCGSDDCVTQGLPLFLPTLDGAALSVDRARTR